MYRIFYGPREYHDDTDGAPTGDCARGVQVILQSDLEVGWSTQSGDDYYVWRDGRWWGCDIAGLFDFLLDTGIVLFGRMIDRGEFSQIFTEAMEDKALAKKTGFLPRRLNDRRP